MSNLITSLAGTLVFVQLNKPVDCFTKEKGKEWKASIVVDEDTADAWAEQFPKQAAKVIKTAEFSAIYKTDPPYPNEKKQYIITVRKNTKLGNGEEVPELYQPKVLLAAEGRKDVTHTVIPANGSTGKLSLDIWESQNGPVARLKNVLVLDLIEFEGNTGGVYTPGDEFGDNEGSEPEVKAEAPKKTIKVTKPKEVKETKPAEDAPVAVPADEDDPF